MQCDATSTQRDPMGDLPKGGPEGRPTQERGPRGNLPKGYLPKGGTKRIPTQGKAQRETYPRDTYPREGPRRYLPKGGPKGRPTQGHHLALDTCQKAGRLEVEELKCCGVCG